MLILASTTDKLKIITGSAGTIDVHVSWMDNNAGNVSVGRTNTNITTAATTDVVAPPAASGQRNIKTMHVRNRGTAANDITVVHDDGSVAVQIHKSILPPSGTLQYIDEVGFGVILGGGSPSQGGGFGGSTAFTTGDVKITFKSVPDPGWIIADDGSIGDSNSGATSRANADTINLFILFYAIASPMPPQGVTITIANPAVFTSTSHGLMVGQRVNFATTGALPTGISTGVSYYVLSAGFTANAFQVSTSVGGPPVATTGTQSGSHTVTPIFQLTLQDSAGAIIARGLDATTDYAAHRRMVIPRVLGRALCSAGTGIGLPARALGSALGTEGSTPTLANMVVHSHGSYGAPYPYLGSSGLLFQGAVSPMVNPGGYISGNFLGADYQSGATASAGGGEPFNTLQPSSFLNVMIKL